MSFIPRLWKSIQAVTVTFAGGTTATATLSPSVVAANCLVLLGGATSIEAASGLLVGSSLPWVSALSNTLLTCTQYGTGNNVWYGYVIEFLAPFVKSSGTSSIAYTDTANSSTATITGVVTANTVVGFTGWGFNGNYTFDGAHQVTDMATPRVVLTNSTTITATKPNSGQAIGITVGYSYVEFR